MSSIGDLWIWHDSQLSDHLSWYRDVADNRRPAKFRIAASTPVAQTHQDLEEASEASLWTELDRLTSEFMTRFSDIRAGSLPPMDFAEPSLLDLLSTLARRMLSHCNFCEWNCGVDRAEGRKFGTCKLGSETRVSTFFHHPGEELIYRGQLGSGTIFFTSCNMRCAFCQNGDISTDKDNGMAVDARTLAAMAWMLRQEGCHNINWVGGDPQAYSGALGARGKPVHALVRAGGDAARARDAGAGRGPHHRYH